MLYDEVKCNSAEDIAQMLDLSGLSYETATTLIRVSECMITDAKNSEDAYGHQLEHLRAQRNRLMEVKKFTDDQLLELKIPTDAKSFRGTLDGVLDTVREQRREIRDVALLDLNDTTDFFTAVKFVLESIPRPTSPPPLPQLTVVCPACTYMQSIDNDVCSICGTSLSNIPFIIS